MSHMPTDPATAAPFLALAEGGSSPALSASPPLAALRVAARERFAEMGLPTQKHELWRYTGLRGLSKLDFDVAATVAARDTAIDALPSALSEGSEGTRLVFVNGGYRADLSSIGDAIPEGVIVSGLAEALDGPSQIVAAVMGSLIDIDAQPLAALNTAFLDDGLCVVVPAGVVVEAPIEVVFVTTGVGVEKAAVSQPRCLISVGAGGQATVIEHHVGAGEGPRLENTVTEALVGAGATLRHYIHQNAPVSAFHIANTAVAVGADGNYESFALTTGAGLSRHDIQARLGGNGASCAIDGAYLINGDQHADTTTRIEHAATHTTSRQVYKGVIDDRGRAVFQGKIVVERGAVKTDGHQLCKTLLLSDQAEIDAKPELEIYADDVKCSHGATCGELSDEQFFYLRARGISQEDARNLLIGAFVSEAIDTIGDETARAAFASSVQAWLKAQAPQTSHKTSSKA